LSFWLGSHLVGLHYYVGIIPGYTEIEVMAGQFHVPSPPGVLKKVLIGVLIG